MYDFIFLLCQYLNLIWDAHKQSASCHACFKSEGFMIGVELNLIAIRMMFFSLMY